MIDIDFARNNIGKFYSYRGVTVRIVGFEFLGEDKNIIVAGYPNGWFQSHGWHQSLISPDDNILVELDPKERLYYVSMDELTEIEK